MSMFNVATLRAATDETIPSFLREAENGTTAAIRHNTMLEFGLIGKGARVINNDAADNLIIRLHSRQGTALIIPPSSELVIEEWFQEIHAEPDAVTGAFQITLELAETRDARRLMRRGG